MGPGPLLPRRTVGAATPRPQAPGHCLRDRLAAQLMRAPGHRHTWGCKAGKEGTSSVRLARPRGLEERRVLRLLPQCRGSTGRGHSIVSPDGRVGEPHVTEHVSEAPESLTGLGTNPTINPRGGSCFSQRTDTKAEPQETPRTRNHGSAKGSIDAPRTGNRLCPRQQRNCRKTGNL